MEMGKHKIYKLLNLKPLSHNQCMSPFEHCTKDEIELLTLQISFLTRVKYFKAYNTTWKGTNPYYSPFTRRNQPKCNHSIYNYHNLRLDLGIFTITRPNFKYFRHFYNYDTTIKIFILLVGSILHLFWSINRLICHINHNSHQINCILKVFYNGR
jgi:hypothetical protein